jgi:hypothetical protein
LEILERHTINNHIVVIEPVGLRQLASHIRLLLATVATK